MTLELRWAAFRRMSWVWSLWERLYLWLWPTQPVRAGSLFRVRDAGAVIELHLDGRELSRLRGLPGYSTFATLHRLREELGVLAARVEHGEFPDANVLKGTSLMGEAGGILGFKTRKLPHDLGNALQQYFFVGLDAIYHPSGLRERAKRRWPVETTMTRAELLRRYAPKSDSSTVAR